MQNLFLGWNNETPSTQIYWTWTLDQTQTVFSSAVTIILIASLWQQRATGLEIKCNQESISHPPSRGHSWGNRGSTNRSLIPNLSISGYFTYIQWSYYLWLDNPRCLWFERGLWPTGNRVSFAAWLWLNCNDVYFLISYYFDIFRSIKPINWILNCFTVMHGFKCDTYSSQWSLQSCCCVKCQERTHTPPQTLHLLGHVHHSGWINTIPAPPGSDQAPHITASLCVNVHHLLHTHSKTFPLFYTDEEGFLPPST